MAIFDKMTDRIRDVKRKLKTDPLNSKWLTKLKSLEEKPPEYWIRYYDPTGTEHREKVGPSFQEAEKAERKKRNSIDEGKYSSSQFMKASIKKIYDIYLEERMKNKPSYKDSKSLGQSITKYLGNMKLSRLNTAPFILIQFFQDFPNKRWEPKSIWNFKASLRASIGYYIKTRRLHILNPVDVVDIEKGTNVRTVLPTVSDYELLREKCLNWERKFRGGKYREGFTRIEKNIYLWLLVTACWETGLRVGEVLKWRWEKMELDINSDKELPWFEVQITKQKRKVIKHIPMSFELWQALKGIPGQKEVGYIFPWKNRPGQLTELYRRCGLSHLHNHDMRKSWKTTKKAAGFSSDLTMDAQGHATRSMDDYYTILDRTELEQLVKPSWDMYFKFSCS